MACLALRALDLRCVSRGVFFFDFLCVCLSSSASTSLHSSMKSPARHLLIRDFTSACVTRHWVRPPLVGLARIHRGSMKNFRQAFELDGSCPMEEHWSAIRPAQASLAPFGTCCRVESLTLSMESSVGRELASLQRSRVADCRMVNDVVALTEPGPKSGERPGWAGWAQEGPWQIGWHSFPTSQEGS